jgi:TfuA protein
MREAVFIFAGPSIFGTKLEADSDITWLPPARRGDIEEIITKNTRPGVIGLADGTFHSYPSVSHVELREAIQIGWRVYGLCSMGAIRVSEMRHMGMIAWGRVAKMFCSMPNYADDEVALLHGAEAPYAPLSEPLVHIREFCAQALKHGWLNCEQAQEIIDILRHRWYGERTLTNLRHHLCKVLRLSELPHDIRQAIDDFKPFRLKQQDLESFLLCKPWIGEVKQ